MGGVLRALSPREELIAELEEAGFDLWEETPQDWRATHTDEQLRAAVKVAREAPDYPDIGELVEAIDEVVAADDAWRASPAKWEKPTPSAEWQRFEGEIQRLRNLQSDIAKAQEATK